MKKRFSMKKMLLAGSLLLYCGVMIMVINATGFSENDAVQCYVTIAAGSYGNEDETAGYHLGDEICLIANVVEPRPTSTGNNFRSYGGWHILWQRNDNEADPASEWYDIGEGWNYNYELDEDSKDASYRFIATRDS